MTSIRRLGACALVALTLTSCGENSSTALRPTMVGAEPVYRVTISYGSGNSARVEPPLVSVLVPGSVDFVFNVNGGVNCRLTFGKHTWAPLPPDIDWALGSRTVRRRFISDREDLLHYSVDCYAALGGGFRGSGMVDLW